MKTTLVVRQDPVADALDDMAALALQWTRNRERGRMPSGIRQAMLLVAREVLEHADADDRELARKIGDLRGSGAYARSNSAVVLVCPERDLECGEHEVGWCKACPKRNWKWETGTRLGVDR